jgi:hypothetical protein
MQLTAKEQGHTCQVAAQIDRNLDDLIREGEQRKATGRRSAQQQAEGCAALRRRRRPRDGPRPEPGPLRRPQCHGGAPRPPRAGSPERMRSGARLMTGTGSGREPNWDDLAAPIAPTPPWRTEGQRQAEEPDPGWAGRASPGQARIQPLSGSPAATPSLRRGRDAHPQTPAGERPKARLGEPDRHALGRSE